jgi:hypothetical protein
MDNLMIKEVNFSGDKLLALQRKDDKKIFVGMD